MRSVWLYRVMCIMAMGSALMTVPAQGSEKNSPRPIPGTSFEQHVIKDGAGREVTYYMSRPKTGTAPLLLMIQGSGCVPVIIEQQGGAYSTLFNVLPFGYEGRFTLLVVEKPFSAKAERQSCSPEFNDDFTAESWLKALQASIKDARKSPWVDLKRTLVFGHSEGAVMATMVAANDASITDVVVIGGSGTTQLYDFVVHAYRTCFDVPGCLANVENNVRAIGRNPNSSTEMAWGHPFKRWSSFFRIDPAEQLLRSKARVYVAFGTADNAVPALSQEISVAKLLVAGRDLTVRRVPDADHSLRRAGATDVADMDREYRAALDWFWQAK